MCHACARPGRRLWVPVLLVLAVLAAAPVEAHGPPEPRDFETRVLVDENDDCGGHGGSDNCRGSHDLVGFNVREAYDKQLGHVVIFTLIADGGDPSQGVLRDTFTYRAGGSAKTVVFETSDGQGFSVSGAAKVVGPQPLLAGGSADGTRFTVDAWFLRDGLGLALGDKLQDFKVEAQAGSTAGDIMPGSYVSPLTGEPAPTTEPDAYCRDNPCTSFRRPSYTLSGPDQYIRLSPAASVEVDVGTTEFVDLRVQNLLSDMAQTVRFTRQAEGVDVGFHDPRSAQQDDYPTTFDNAIPKGGEEIVHLAVTGRDAGSSGHIRLTLTTDRGGLATGSVAYTVGAAVPTGGNDTGPEGPEEESPVAGAAVLLVLAAAAARRR